VPQPNQENPYDADAYRDPEAQLGGADNVEKTTYVKGEGTSPEARRPEAPIATVGSGGAPRAITWVVVAIVVLVAVVYLLGVGR
jgi:hypothetical protein